MAEGLIKKLSGSPYTNIQVLAPNGSLAMDAPQDRALPRLALDLVSGLGLALVVLYQPYHGAHVHAALEGVGVLLRALAVLDGVVKNLGSSNPLPAQVRVRPVRGGFFGRPLSLAFVFQQERQEPLGGLLLRRGTVICPPPSRDS